VLFGVLVVLASGGTLVATRLAVKAATSGITQVSLLPTPTSAAPTHASVDGPKNLLLVGIDPRDTNSVSKDGIRSDSIMILHIDAAHTGAYLVSIPRDTYVAIPANNNGKYRYGGGHSKINAAFAFGAEGLTGLAAEQGGMVLLAATVSKLTGIARFDAAAIVDFNGFRDLVGVLGTVHMYVDEDTRSIHIGTTRDGKEAAPFTQDKNLNLHAVAGVTPVKYTVGWHDFTPSQALDYVRQRELLANNDFDYGRQRHQQQFVKAVFRQISERGLLTNLTQLKEILDAVGKAMIVDSGGVSLEDWIFAMRDIGADDLVTINTNGGHPETRTVSGAGQVEDLNATSVQLLQAVHDDAVAGFVRQHQDWVAHS
jgi:LCP family protein required for cell wall assembly